jgi:hypothetical protein
LGGLACGPIYYFQLSLELDAAEILENLPGKTDLVGNSPKTHYFWPACTHIRHEHVERQWLWDFHGDHRTPNSGVGIAGELQLLVLSCTFHMPKKIS